MQAYVKFFIQTKCCFLLQSVSHENWKTFIDKQREYDILSVLGVIIHLKGNARILKILKFYKKQWLSD